MKTPESLLREYFNNIDDINGNETIKVLPLTIIDMLIEYGEICFNAGKEEIFNELYCDYDPVYDTYEDYLNDLENE